ncbi:uncharacterized protein TNCV_2817641 [Trichonephila clavipes]|nr:uncharacterized protein TNCV_2817641 [Trichonephila clavipes]
MSVLVRIGFFLSLYYLPPIIPALSWTGNRHEDNLGIRYHQRADTSQWRPFRVNFSHSEVGGAAGVGGLQEVYFSGSENVEDFIEGIDNQIKILEIPSDLSCAYLKRSSPWKGSRPWTIFFVRLEPRVQDYLEVRNPTTTAQLLHVLAKFERNSHKKNARGSKLYSGNVERRGWNAKGNYESRQRNQWIESRNELNRDDRRFDRGYQSRNRVQSENFSQGTIEIVVREQI